MWRTALRGAFAATLLTLAVPAPTAAEASASLRGTSGSMARQTRVANQHRFTYLRDPSHVRQFVEQGFLVSVPGNRDYELAKVSFPYARPEVKLFIERLSRQYKDACGEKLVVTSLTRPRTHQPSNASPVSVHQAGMALDLRRSWNRRCRGWLERVLLSLERQRVIEANYERRPPHYHVAVFPKQYKAYVAKLQGGDDLVDELPTYRVRRGDTLWRIARRHRTTVEELRLENSLRSSRIRPGQILRLPVVR